MAPLLRLLGYIRAHRRYALLTVVFGVLSFGLSFVYPWIIGAAVELLERGGAYARLVRHQAVVL